MDVWPNLFFFWIGGGKEPSKIAALLDTIASFSLHDNDSRMVGMPISFHSCADASNLSFVGRPNCYNTEDLTTLVVRTQRLIFTVAEPAVVQSESSLLMSLTEPDETHSHVNLLKFLY